jgi:tight adherence protein C
MLLALALVCLFGAVFLTGEVVSFGARQRAAALKRAAGYARPRIATSPERPSFRQRVLDPAVDRLARVALRVNPKVSVDVVRFKLLSAGLGGRVSPTAFLAAKAGCALGFGLLGLLLGASAGPLGGPLFALALAVGGFVMPGILVSARARSRGEQIRADLPDALDLLAVSVEAGLGFDGALDKLAGQIEGPLAEEFALTLGEIRIGESRHDALRKLAERVDTPEVASFTRAIIQADQLGNSLGRILKVQAADARTRRQLAAEEKAAKAPIKMLFPTAIFIFPAMFLVILGPAFLNLAEIF